MSPLIKFNFSFIPSINKIVKFFIISDLFLWSGWGFIDPLFSIFLIKNVHGATFVAIGFLAAIYWVTKSILQIPVSLFLDKTNGEKDDFYALVFGLMISGITAFSLMLAEEMWQVYIIQFVKAVGFALYIPAWTAIFSRHLDKDHTAFDWALSSSSVGLSIGMAGFIGSFVASKLGFNLVFLMVGLSSLLSAAVLLFVPDLILPRKTSVVPAIKDHSQIGKIR